MGWTPPRDLENRIEASGSLPSDPLLRRATCDPAAWNLFPALAPPRRGDWLANGAPGEHDRRGQTYDQYLRMSSSRTFPSKRRQTIELVPFGSTEDLPPDALEIFVDCVCAHFGVPCRLAEPVDSGAALRECGRSAGYGAQIFTETVHDSLARVRQPSAFLTVAFTMHDLTKKEGDWNFVCAHLHQSCQCFLPSAHLAPNSCLVGRHRYLGRPTRRAHPAPSASRVIAMARARTRTSSDVAAWCLLMRSDTFLASRTACGPVA